MTDGEDRSAADSVADARAHQQQLQREARLERERRFDEAFAEGVPGRWISSASWLGTIALAVVSVLALVDPDAFLPAFFVATFALFTLGAALLALDVVLAAARSTTHAMGIGGLFFLAGSAPRAVQYSLNGSLLAAVLVSVGVAVVGLSTPELAFGTLVPTLQLSLTGLWGVRHGLFPERSGESDRQEPPLRGADR